MLRAASSVGNLSGLQYQGTWNASTNTPTLTSSVGTAGYYYIVSTAGATTLNGISTWNVGDWVIFSNTGVWQRIAGGLTGSVNIANDTSGNVNYNLVLTNANSGTVSTFDVDSPNLTFNPSTSKLNAQIFESVNTIGFANVPQFRMSGASAGVVAFYDNSDPDFGVYNYRLHMDNSYITFCMSNTNTAYDIGNTLFAVNQYGAIGLGVNSYYGSGALQNYGGTGQVLISSGTNAAATWGNIKTPATTYSGLGSAATAGAGARGFITDCTTTTFLATAAGGGSNAVPVVSNGTNWLVG